MMRVAANFVGDSSDTGGSIPESDDFFLFEISNAGNMIELSLSIGSFLLHSGFRLLVELGVVLLETHCLGTVISFSVRSVFIKVLMTRCFTVEFADVF